MAARTIVDRMTSMSSHV